MSEIQLYKGDCLEIMNDIPDASIDMVLCDLPYGVLSKSNPSAKWDSIIPFEPLWAHYKRVCKDNAAIVLFAQGMFTAKLMMSNPDMWRYNLVWQKDRVTGFLNANKMPLRTHEDVLVFYNELPTYNPQMWKGNKTHPRGFGKHRDQNRCYGDFKQQTSTITNEHFPISVLYCPKEHKNFYHATQKPVDLLRYLIRTYSNEGDMVLDNCMGSGSTGVACVNTCRDFIGIELDEEYFKIAEKRINNELSQLKLF